MHTTCSLLLVGLSMAFGVGLLLAFILAWMSLDSAIMMALAIPASVKHYLLGTWSASYVTCQEPVFVAGCLFSAVGSYVLQIVRGPRASPLVATLDHGSATSRHATCPDLFSLPFAANDSAGQRAPRRVPVRNGGVAYPVCARGRWYERQPAPESIV